MIYIPMKVRHEVKALAAGRIFEFYITDDIKPDGERFNWDVDHCPIYCKQGRCT